MGEVRLGEKRLKASLVFYKTTANRAESNHRATVARRQSLTAQLVRKKIRRLANPQQFRAGTDIAMGCL
jgi:hypothetical protein